MIKVGLTHSFTHLEKLNALALFHIFSKGGDIPHSIKLRKERVQHYAELSGVSEIEYIYHVDTYPLSEMCSELHDFDDNKVEILITMSIDLLKFVEPTEKDLIRMENLFHNLVGVPPEYLHKSLRRIMDVTIYFNEKKQVSQTSPSNAVSQVYDRMIKEAQDPNQSPFSLNNIVFTVFIFLAILGLVSLCS